jgi:hypothetical protein
MNERLSAYLSYFERIATQPINRWDGFDLDASTAAGMKVRDQLALMTLALGALATHPECSTNEHERCLTAINALIGRMLQRRVWSDYAEAAGERSISLDPVADGNVGFSGQLALMLGVYVASGGDGRYNEPFVLHWSKDARYSYTHETLVATLWRQMRAHPDAAIADTPPLTSASLMAAALWATALHDAVYGSEFASANATWLATAERRLQTRGPRWLVGGIFRTHYHGRRRRGVGRGSYEEDARALALYAPHAPELAQRGAKRLWSALKHAADGTSFLPTRAADTAHATLANAWAYLLAVELGERQHSEGLLAHAEANFGPQDAQDERSFAVGLASTALIALGEAGGVGRLFGENSGFRIQDSEVTR